MKSIQYRFHRIGKTAFFCYVSILVLQIKLLWGAWYYWDLPLWDGASYYKLGQVVANSLEFPPIESSPFFAGYYALFHLFFTNTAPFHIYFWHRTVAILLIGILFHTMLRAKFSPFVAWLLAVYIIQVKAIVYNTYVVHSFVLIPLLGAYLASLGDSKFKNGIILTCLLVASLTRPEFLLSFTFAIPILIFSDYITNGKQKALKWQYIIYGPFIIVLILILNTSIRNSSVSPAIHRSWLAFGQHYAWGYGERQPEWNKNHWLEWEEVVKLSFGNSKSVIEAAFHNPLELFSHILWNLYILPGELINTFASTHWMFNWYLILLISLAVVALVTQISQIKLIGDYTFWVVVLCTLLPVSASILIVRPRWEYLLTLLPFSLLIIGLGLNIFLKYKLEKKLEWILPLLFMLFFVIFPMPFAQYRERSIISATEALKGFSTDGTYGILAENAGAFCAYLNAENCRGVEISDVPTQTSFQRYLQEENIQVIALNESLAYSLPPDGQNFMIKLFTNTDQTGWQEFGKVPGFRLYTRNQQ